MTTRSLTERQEHILGALISTTEAGSQATLRELASSLRIVSCNVVIRHLQRLEQKGFIRRGPKGAPNRIRILRWPDGSLYWQPSMRLAMLINALGHHTFADALQFALQARDVARVSASSPGDVSAWLNAVRSERTACNGCAGEHLLARGVHFCEACALCRGSYVLIGPLRRVSAPSPGDASSDVVSDGGAE